MENTWKEKGQKMKRVQLIEYKGKKITSLDFSSCDKKLIPDLIEEAEALVKTQPLNSVLTLTDLTDFRFDAKMIELFKELTAHNKPYVKAGAIIGIKGLQKVAYDAVMRFSNRNIPLFSDRQEALEWLINQE